MPVKRSDSIYYENQPNPGNFVGRLALKARRDMFARLTEIADIHARTSILDVGVTSDKRIESNFLEKLYPYRENITAVGLEDALFLCKECPGIKYLKADGLRLPFSDQSFDLVTSFAVIEHVGSRDRQQRLVQELCRVGKSCMVTTPNRWYPFEVHTMLPLIHWLPSPAFRMILKKLGKEFYAREENLNLLDAKSLRRMFPQDMKVSENHYRLFGITSNLFFFARYP